MSYLPTDYFAPTYFRALEPTMTYLDLITAANQSDADKATADTGVSTAQASLDAAKADAAAKAQARSAAHAACADAIQKAGGEVADVAADGTVTVYTSTAGAPDFEARPVPKSDQPVPA
jgi:hypothetical protein